MINRSTNSRSRGAPWSLIGAGVLSLAALLFLVKNSQEVRVHLLVTTVVMPLWAALLVAMVLGGLIAMLFMWWRGRRRSR
jgi:uncharacterized integral membrane protein